jgi:hypothetical protein
MYSTTYTALRVERSKYNAGIPHDPTEQVITDSLWRFTGSGHTPGAALIAAGIADDRVAVHVMARQTSPSIGGDAV